MPDLREQLHDEIDQLEGLKDEAREVVAAIVRDELDAIIAASPDLATAMHRIAEEVEDGLAELTTKAFKTGVGFSKRRFGEQ